MGVPKIMENSPSGSGYFELFAKFIHFDEKSASIRIKLTTSELHNLLYESMIFQNATGEQN